MKPSIILYLVIALAVLSSCNDLLPELEELETYVTFVAGNQWNKDSLGNKEPNLIKPVMKGEIYLPSVSCTGALYNSDITYSGDQQVIAQGVCYGTSENPTIDDNIAFTEESHLYITRDIYYRFRSEIYPLEPSTFYYVRPFLTISSGTFYGDVISFKTNPRPTIKTIGINFTTSTSATITGKIISAGGSFVVAQGVCYSLTSGPEAYSSNPYIEREVQSFGWTGEFSICLTNLTPATTYHVKAFMAVMTGIYYGDQLIECGNELIFTTNP